jgi:hypothetical protein
MFARYENVKEKQKVFFNGYNNIVFCAYISKKIYERKRQRCNDFKNHVFTLVFLDFINCNSNISCSSSIWHVVHHIYSLTKPKKRKN